MKVDRVELLRLSLPFRETFSSSVSMQSTKEFYLLKIYSGEYVGYGESGTTNDSFYVEETNCSLRYQLDNFLLPMLFERELETPSDFVSIASKVRRNYMAKAVVESALWDLFSKAERVPLWRKIGGVRRRIEAGISIGVQATWEDLFDKVAQAQIEGYRRVKIKIEPGKDYEWIRRIRQSFPEMPLMVDANGAYSPSDMDELCRFDELDLMMIEQPFGVYDLLGHAALAKKMKTPLCLDESICSVEDLGVVMTLKAASVVNLKVARVGGVSEAISIEKLCRENGLSLWCGGLYEAGVGRALNLAVASLPGVDLPGDTSPSRRYFVRDVLKDDIDFVEPGVLVLSESSGLGVELDDPFIEQIALERSIYTKTSMALD
jgi:O-succinylbenzoate synthase